MVKELVMDNMYNPDMLSDRMKGADRFAFDDTSAFQNIFDNKNTYSNVDDKFYPRRDLSLKNNNTSDGGRFSDNNGFVKQNRFETQDKYQDRVRPDSTTRTPDKLTNTSDRKFQQDNFTESDGYSFSVRDSLQERSVEVDSCKDTEQNISNETTTGTSDTIFDSDDAVQTEDLLKQEGDYSDNNDSTNLDSEKTDIKTFNTQPAIENITDALPVLTQNITAAIPENVQIAANTEIPEKLEDITNSLSGYNSESVIDDAVITNNTNSSTLQAFTGVETETKQPLDNGIQISSDDGWEILDKNSQYEYTDMVMINETSEAAADTTAEVSANSNLTQTVETIDENSITESETFKKNQINDSILKSELQTEVTAGGDIETETISNNSSNSGAGADENPVTETRTDNEAPSNSIENGDLKSQIVEDEDAVLDSVSNEEKNVQKQKTRVQEQTETDLRSISPDEQSDTDVEQVTGNENDDSEITVDEENTDTEIEIISDTENLTDSENPKSGYSNEKYNNDADTSLQERTRLAYVDMTNVSEPVENDILTQLENRFGSDGNEIYSSVSKETDSVNDLINNTDADAELLNENKMKAASLEEVVDEGMADELNIKLTDNASGSKQVYSGTNSTAEQLIRYSIEGETGFDNRLASALKQNVSQQSSNVMTNSKEILAQINEKLTTFNFRPGAKLTMQLSPENLGTVEIKLTNTLEGIRAEMTATSDDAGNALNKHIDDLRDTLQKYGVRLDRVSVSTTQPQQSNTQQDYTEQGHSQRQQQEQKGQYKEERGTQKFEDMVSSFYEEGNKE